MTYRGITLFVVILALSLSSYAVTPQFWENFSQEEMLKGTLTRVSLSSDGRLFLAPSYDLVFDTQQPFIFSLVRDKAGNIFAGTGHEGKVFKIDSKGQGSLYFQSKELDVFALALDANDVLYVGTSPDGKIYKVTGPNQASEFFNPEDKYIWSMLFDGAGNLYVGTGTRGIIYKVDRSGKASTFANVDDQHIIALARGSNANLLAGTSPDGKVIEISAAGKAFTLWDSQMQEIHSLTVDRYGTIYAVASSSKDAAGKTTKDGARTSTSSLSATALITSMAGGADKSKDVQATISVPGNEPDASGLKSVIYAITREGSYEIQYSSKDQMVYDAIVRDDGSLLAATGGKGRLLSIDPSKQVTVVTDSPEEQITRLIPAGNFVWAAGSNQGKIYRLDSQLAQTGTFASKPLDARMVASWGKISWRLSTQAGTELSLTTRSGNTDQPDNSWSDWSAPYTTSAGQQITSPRARYLQWRAAFSRGSNPGSATTTVNALERIQIPFIQQNVRPQVVSITLLPYGVGLQKTPALASGSLNLTTAGSDGLPLNSPRERGRERQYLPPRQVLQPGAQSVNWKAADANDDTLEYAIFFKGEGEADWKLLDNKLTETFYTLDAAALPDGVYRLKILASDAPSNPYNKSLVGELVSSPFVISNSTPQLEIGTSKINGKKIEASFSVRVPTGHVASAEFSIDGGEWHLLFPADGIADSMQEEYLIATPELSPGEHVIGMRSSDANGNTGTAKLVVKVP
jgi:hypothetical protein